MSMSSGMAMDVVESHDDAVVEMASTNHSLYNTAAATNNNNYNTNANNWDTASTEPLRSEIEIGASANFFKSNDDDASAEQGEKNYAMNGRWDAFASLQANYESSSSDEDDDEDDDSNSSSDEVESNAGDSDCSNGDFGDDCDIDGDGESHSDGDDYRDGSYHNDSRHTAKLTSQQPTNNSVECINLLDSDEDDIIATSGKENEKNIQPKSSRLRKRPTMKRHGIESSESDSSLSEEEGHRHRQRTPPSSTRGLPAWQPPRRRQSSSTPIQTKINNGNIKSSDQFSCMSIRNDVIGNAPSPCIVTNKKNEAQVVSKVSIEGGRRRQPSKKSSTSTKTASVASASRKKTRTTPKTAVAAASSRGGAKKAPAKRRRRGRGKFRKRSTYKRSSAKSSSGSRGAESSNNSNNAWSERERGIRQPYRRGGGGGGGGGGGSSTAGPYMAIAKQEPMLRNVGGASIQF